MKIGKSNILEPGKSNSVNNSANGETIFTMSRQNIYYFAWCRKTHEKNDTDVAEVFPIVMVVVPFLRDNRNVVMEHVNLFERDFESTAKNNTGNMIFHDKTFEKDALFGL